MQITAAVARAAGAPFSIEAVELDVPRDDEVLVRIVGSGICHTDLISRDQHLPVPLPAILGHEGAGIVERTGNAVTHLKAGDPVVLSFLSCGSCGNCGQDMPSYCESFVPLNFSGARPDGSTGAHCGEEALTGRFFGQSAFATYALAHQRNTIRVDSPSDLDLFGPLGCGFQTGAGGVMRALACEAGSAIAILGCGAVGIAAVMGAAIQHCGTIIAVEPIAVRREKALQLGATHAIDPAAGDVAQAIRAIAPAGVDYLFDTSGMQGVIENAMSALALRGTAGLVAAATPDTAISVNLTGLVLAGQTVRGIVEGDSDPATLIPELVQHYRAGCFPIDQVVQRYPLAEINAAIDAQHRGECIKAVLVP